MTIIPNATAAILTMNLIAKIIKDVSKGGPIKDRLFNFSQTKQ
jgi:hypothetical protein